MSSLSNFSSPRHVRIAVVGDVHEAWDGDDPQILQKLGIDLVLFVGDFGNESVATVQAVAQMPLPKAVVLGNHDAWYTASPWGRKKSPYDHRMEDRVQQQLDLLGNTHVGYGKLDFPQLGFTVVGSRPFSWGGQEWKNEQFYGERYGIHTFQESIDRISTILQTAANETILFLGHCGPYGLGDRPEDPCGRDWQPLGGDFGDPDFAKAIHQARQSGKRVPLVAFGHMHHQLRHRPSGHRTMFHIDSHGTCYVNAAEVPRIKRGVGSPLHHFMMVELKDNHVMMVSQAWVTIHGRIHTSQLLYCSNHHSSL